MIPLLIATTNAGKLKEVKALLSGTSFKLKAAGDLQVAETGITFRQNAIIKARAYAQHYQIPTIADDSGLIIDSLDGCPGVHSARFAAGNHSKAIKTILGQMQSVPTPKRTARFVCSIAFYHPATGDLKTFTGTSRGLISAKPKGSGGFGYDSIFFLPQLGLTFAQLSASQKNVISHRAKALVKLKNYLIMHYL